MKPLKEKPKKKGLENFQVGEQAEMLGKWHTQRGHISFTPLPTLFAPLKSSSWLPLSYTHL